MVASGEEESDTDSSCSTPLRPRQPPGGAPVLSQLESLQGKLSELEEENMTLRSEVQCTRMHAHPGCVVPCSCVTSPPPPPLPLSLSCPSLHPSFQTGGKEEHTVRLRCR